MKSKTTSLLLASLVGAALAGTAVAQTATSPATPNPNNMGSTNPAAGALVGPGGTNPATGAPLTPTEADKARADANARSRNDSEIRANQIRREAEEAATRSRGSAALPQSGTPAGSLGAGTGPIPGSTMSGGSSAFDRGAGTFPGNPSTPPTGVGRPGG